MRASNAKQPIGAEQFLQAARLRNVFLHILELMRAEAAHARARATVCTHNNVLLHQQFAVAIGIVPWWRLPCSSPQAAYTNDLPTHTACCDSLPRKPPSCIGCRRSTSE